MFREENIKKTEPIGNGRFSFNANIIKKMGEESISNPYIAMAELVKNAYDACAETVTIDLGNQGSKNEYFSIIDDGVGMDLLDIEEKWMDVANSHKELLDKVGNCNRVPVGAKGVGRFASQCLGDVTKVFTGKKKDRIGYKLTFDWTKFVSSKKATDIDNTREKFIKELSKSGTTVRIEGLKHSWNNQERLEKFVKDIYLLTTPLKVPKNFKIKYNVGIVYGKIKKIDKMFLIRKHAYRLITSLIKEKEISYSFYKNDKLVKRDKVVLDQPLKCGDVSFEMFFFYLRSNMWEKWINIKPPKKELDEIKEKLKDFGGIKLYRDGFRVKPYGEKTSDWIGLDDWSRNNTMAPGNAQVFGVVNIGKEKNPMIIDTTTREGVVNNDEYFDLVRFITTSISDIFISARSEQESTKAKARKIKKNTSQAKVSVVSPKFDDIVEPKETITFIDAKGNYPRNYYNAIVKEINACERDDYPNAVFALSRKMIENLIFHILEKRFPSNQEYYYDTVNSQRLMFSALVKNLHSRNSDFKLSSRKYIEQFNTDVGPFRKEVNSTMHNAEKYLTECNELKKFKIPKLIELLLHIYETQFSK